MHLCSQLFLADTEVITGAIKSKFHYNLLVKTLPVTSLYLPEAKSVEDETNGHGVGAKYKTPVNMSTEWLGMF